MAAPLLRRCCVCVRLCGAAALRVQPLFLHTGTDYRSTRSLLNTDPIRGCRYASTTAEHAGDGHLQKTTDIPVDRLTVSYSRSSGPGGQHVNKVNTKAEIRFHIHTADWIPEDVRQKIIQKNKNRINKSGELFVTSEISRYQMRNFADCLQKIRDIITEASFKPREASEEDTARRKNRLEKINQERLKQKKMHSSVKQSRRVQFD